MLLWSLPKWLFSLGFLQGEARGGCLKSQKMLVYWNKLPNLFQHPDPKLVPSSSLSQFVAHSQSTQLEAATSPHHWAPRNFAKKWGKPVTLEFFSSLWGFPCLGMIQELHGLTCFGKRKTAKYSPIAEHPWVKQGGKKGRRRKRKSACGRLFPLFCLFVPNAWLVGFSSTQGTGTDFLSLCDMHF